MGLNPGMTGIFIQTVNQDSDNGQTEGHSWEETARRWPSASQTMVIMRFT